MNDRERRMPQRISEEQGLSPLSDEERRAVTLLRLQYFGGVAIPTTVLLEILGAGAGGPFLGAVAAFGVAWFAEEIHYGIEPIVRTAGDLMALMTSGKNVGRASNRLLSRDWWLGQDIAPYVDDGEEDDQGDDGVDPEILEMLRSGDGNWESALALIERARLANVEEETGVPSFRKLLEDGTVMRVVRKGLLIIGFVDGKMRLGTWKDFYSIGVGGVSGSGKTTTVRFLMFQMILAGGHLIMVDPHIGDEEESLAAEFRGFVKSHLMPPCGDDEKEVLKRVRWLKAECLFRKSQGIKGPPVLFVLDEYNALVRRLSDSTMKELADLLLTLAQEGRKFGLFAMIIAQRWSENDLGGKNYGAAIRTSLSSRMGHRFADEDQAKRFMGTKYGPKLLEIAKGHHLFRDTEGAINETVTPNTIQSDGELVRKLMPQQGVSFPTALPGREVDVEEEVDPLDEEEEEEEIIPVQRPVALVKPRPIEVPVAPVVIPERGPRASEIDLAAAIAVWNAGFNSENKLMKAFPNLTKYQAGLLRDRILEQVGEKQEGVE